MFCIDQMRNLNRTVKRVNTMSGGYCPCDYCSVLYLVGPRAVNGASAYKVWERSHPGGTQEEFFEAITGPPGPEGDPGESAFEVWKEEFGDETSSVQNFIDAITGEKGDTGASAFEVWREEPGNEEKEVQDYIDAITGPKGDPGTDGANGQSAFELWQQTNPGGTPQQFINSLSAPASTRTIEVTEDDIVEVPPGCYYLDVVAIGGGSGGTTTVIQGGAIVGGSGGGSGATKALSLPTKPGDSFSVSVGQGGTRGEWDNDTNTPISPGSGGKTTITYYGVVILEAEGASANSNPYGPGIGGVPGGFDGGLRVVTNPVTNTGTGGSGGGVFGGAGVSFDSVNNGTKGGGGGAIFEPPQPGGRGGDGFAMFTFYIG